jgi:hypothetical protein
LIARQIRAIAMWRFSNFCTRATPGQAVPDLDQALHRPCRRYRPEFLFIFELAAPPSSLLRQSFRNSQDVIITCDLKLHFSDPHFRDGTSMLAVPITSIPLIDCKSKSERARLNAGSAQRADPPVL